VWFILTPVPGSVDHRVLWRAGAPMGADLNNYDFEHVVSDHPKMSRQEWQDIYHEAWKLYYSRPHVETLLRRAGASGVPLMSLVKAVVPFMTMVPVEGIHPLQAGLLRRKHRAERRYPLPQESILQFYPRHIWSTIRKNLELAETILWILKVARRIQRDPNRLAYTDQALSRVTQEVEGTFDILNKTAGAQAHIDHLRKVARLTAAAR
jgi:hypothetical protein